MRWMLLLLLSSVAWADGAVYHDPSRPPPCYPITAYDHNFESNTYPSGFLKWFDNEDSFVVFTWDCDMKYYWERVAIAPYKKNIVGGIQSVASQVKAMSNAQKTEAYINNIHPINSGPEQIPGTSLDPRGAFIAMQRKQTAQPDIKWEVKDSSNSTSRPVFPILSSGARGTTSTGERVSDSLAICSCQTKALEETGGTYCSVSGLHNQASSDPSVRIASDRVALCVRVN